MTPPGDQVSLSADVPPTAIDCRAADPPAQQVSVDVPVLTTSSAEEFYVEGELTEEELIRRLSATC